MSNLEYAFFVCRESDEVVRDVARFVYEATSIDPLIFFESLQAKSSIGRHASLSHPSAVVIAILVAELESRAGSGATDASPLPSPEVVFSLGYLSALLPEKNIILLVDDTHVPDQLLNVDRIYINEEGWEEELGQWLASLGVKVDFDRA